MDASHKHPNSSFANKKFTRPSDVCSTSRSDCHKTSKLLLIGPATGWLLIHFMFCFFSTFTPSKIFPLVVGVCVMVTPTPVTFSNTNHQIECLPVYVNTIHAASNALTVARALSKKNGGKTQMLCHLSVNVR
jgi:hypothetical protein